MKTSLLGLALVGASSVALPQADSRPRPDALTGVVLPSRVVHVGAATEGLLDEVFVERGDHVAAGQLLATLVSDVERANARLAKARAEGVAARDAAEARLALARDQLARHLGLLDDGIIPTTEVQKFRAEVRLAKLALREAEEQIRIAELEYERSSAILEQGRIKSPIDGVVVDRYLSAGEMLTKSGASEVVKLAQLDPLVIELHAPLAFLPNVSIGDRARVRFLGLELGGRFARVAVVDRIVDTASGTFRVRLELPNSDLGIPAGLRCTVLFGE